MDAAFKKALREGLADALGFVLGALAGRALGQSLGFDFFAGSGWQPPQIIGLGLIVLGCGLGRWLFRRLLERMT
ncbi:hypothetical protein [Roseateles violae]|uniref:F0F1-ATPase subunit (Ca2+/Mg2+ transporter) n=1 Tax=Roseateles violae TaxID=3058042 RepID=A0ABT8DRW2_9BURK|nr:hypothetical protein [Pelomonas sp. PFR6]MDN3920798.1 hypothetical protein [Pelomonas sp. PFR6]